MKKTKKKTKNTKKTKSTYLDKKAPKSTSILGCVRFVFPAFHLDPAFPRFDSLFGDAFTVI